MSSFAKENILQTSAVAVILGFLFLPSEWVQAQGVVLPLPTEDQQMIAAQLGPGVVGKALPSTPIDDASVYFPLQEKASTYEVTAGPDSGNTQTYTLGKISRPSGRPLWRFQFSPSLTGFIGQTPEGNLIMPSVDDTSEGVVTIMTPANPFVVKGMKPRETRSYVQRVRIDALDDSTQHLYSGSVKGTYTYLGTYQVTVPAGSYRAVLFRLKCEGRVGPADTHDTAYYFFAPGKGVVAMISQENATVLWIIDIDTVSGEVLTAD